MALPGPRVLALNRAILELDGLADVGVLMSLARMDGERRPAHAA
jgi:hypothetical protein